MAQAISEDDLYRSSSQYRFWSFSSDELATLRASTHSATVQRASQYLSKTTNGTTDRNGDAHMSGGDAASDQQYPTLLSLEEETRLVQRYAEQIRTTCDFFKWSVNVKATAVQYLKRFYLSNSVMTYPPKEIYKSILFLASKTEGTHMTLGEYARRIKTAPEDILAPEYKIIQALRFTLDVRQPFRGLRGTLMELLNLIEDVSAPATTAAPHTLPTQEIKTHLESLSPPASLIADFPASYLSTWRPGTPLLDRAHAAYATARQTLDAPALLSDVYFLFTPPQIHLAALFLADEPLAGFYLDLKLPSPASNGSTNGEHATNGKSEVQVVIRQCAEMLVDYSRNPVMSKEERAALEERLEACRDPGTRDLVGMHAKTKAGDEQAREEKRKGERAKAAGDDVFGPPI